MVALPGTTGRRRVYLMRHGHVTYFQDDGRPVEDPRLVELTALGEAQASMVGQAMGHVPFDVALCSGLPRTVATARAVLAGQDRPPVLEHDLEFEELRPNQDRPGWIAPASREKAMAMMTFMFDSAAEPGLSFGPGGETFASAEQRAVGALIKLFKRPGWSRALIVAHEGINRLILGWMTGAGLNAVGAFEQDLACVNILDFDLVPSEDENGISIQRRIIKAVNLTIDNPVKAGMYLTSIEAIFAPPS